MNFSLALSNKGSLLLTALILASTGTGCANFSTYQTGRTLKPGTGRAVIGGGYYTFPAANDALSSISSSDIKLKTPYFELGYRLGIIDHLDAGLKLTLPGTIAFDAKYQFLDLEGLAIAAGLGGGLLKLDSDTFSGQVLEFIVPIYASYHLGDIFAIYLSPKYMLRIDQAGLSTPTVAAGTSAISHMLGGTAGIKLGDGFGLFAETSFMKPLNYDYSIIQVNGGLFVGHGIWNSWDDDQE